MALDPDSMDMAHGPARSATASTRATMAPTLPTHGAHLIMFQIVMLCKGGHHGPGSVRFQRTTQYPVAKQLFLVKNS